MCRISLGSARQCEFGIPNLPAATAENLASYAGSAAQYRSNPISSRSLPKTGVFKCLPVTIGYFAPKLPKFGLQRLTTNSQKPAIGAPFWHCPGQSLQASDCLAGAEGFEP
jgi:hypothetical protein